MAQEIGAGIHVMLHRQDDHAHAVCLALLWRALGSTALDRKKDADLTASQMLLPCFYRQSLQGHGLAELSAAFGKCRAISSAWTCEPACCWRSCTRPNCAMGAVWLLSIACMEAVSVQG